MWKFKRDRSVLYSRKSSLKDCKKTIRCGKVLQERSPQKIGSWQKTPHKNVTKVDDCYMNSERIRSLLLKLSNFIFIQGNGHKFACEFKYIRQNFCEVSS